ncbi:MAG: hypothetical protein M3Q07_25755 [Pseudobdellovibrionaceae bacterium]|nr:hypothetical protein [Pseudobdellovibrionaceae bacterium]
MNYSTLQTANLSGIAIHDQGISASEKIRHLNELNAMPQAFLDVMRESISINLTAGSITEFAVFAHLKGVTPRGWEGSGYTWDDVPGAGSTGGLYLGDSYRANNAMSLAVHEASHSVDTARSIRTDPIFLNAYNAEKNSPHAEDPNPAYRLQNPEEYLAMAIDEYYCRQETRNQLQKMYPKAYAFVANDLASLLGRQTPGAGLGTYACSPCEDGQQYCGMYEADTWLSGGWASCTL